MVSCYLIGALSWPTFTVAGSHAVIPRDLTKTLDLHHQASNTLKRERQQVRSNFRHYVAVVKVCLELRLRTRHDA
jgi:hypothetical protein